MSQSQLFLSQVRIFNSIFIKAVLDMDKKKKIHFFENVNFSHVFPRVHYVMHCRCTGHICAP
jgi:hypothetical protein